jgi:hypothetical protein
MSKKHRDSMIRSYGSMDRFYQAIAMGPGSAQRLRAEVILEQHFERLTQPEVEELNRIAASPHKQAEDHRDFDYLDRFDRFFEEAA